MISAEAYERAEYQRRLLLHLARGEKDISKGVGLDLDQVLSEADDVLAADRP